MPVSPTIQRTGFLSGFLSNLKIDFNAGGTNVDVSTQPAAAQPGAPTAAKAATNSITDYFHNLFSGSLSSGLGPYLIIGFALLSIVLAGAITYRGKK